MTLQLLRFLPLLYSHLNTPPLRSSGLSGDSHSLLRWKGRSSKAITRTRSSSGDDEPAGKGPESAASACGDAFTMFWVNSTTSAQRRGVVGFSRSPSVYYPSLPEHFSTATIFQYEPIRRRSSLCTVHATIAFPRSSRARIGFTGTSDSCSEHRSR